MVNLRPARADDCAAISDLCFRSKAHWGYDDAFMEASREDLSISAESLLAGLVTVAEDTQTLLGVVEVISLNDTDHELYRLFVAPEAMGRSIGRRLMLHAIAQARLDNAKRLIIDADPHAAPFYEHFGAVRIGMVPSSAIAQRLIPRLRLDL